MPSCNQAAASTVLGCAVRQSAPSKLRTDLLRSSPATVERDWTLARAWLHRPCSSEFKAAFLHAGAVSMRPIGQRG